MWCGKDSRAKAKVYWDKVYVPKREGGMGIKKLEVWNKAVVLNHIWNLFSRGADRPDNSATHSDDIQ